MQSLNPTLWRTCRVLAGPKRLKLLRQIFEGPERNVSRLAGAVRIGEPDASQELRRLQSRGLLRRRAQGANIVYQPFPDPQVASAAPLLKALKTALADPPDNDENLIRIAAGMAHERRIEIARILMRGGKTPRELSALARIRPTPLYHHLQRLKAGGFIHRAGHKLVFQVPHNPLAQTLVKLIR